MMTVLIMCSAMILGGCAGKEPVGNPADTTVGECVLDIYYLADDAGSIHIINSFKSTTADITVNATGFKSVE